MEWTLPRNFVVLSPLYQICVYWYLSWWFFKKPWSPPPLSHSLCLSPGCHASNKMFARFAGSILALSHLPAQHTDVNKCLWAARCQGRQWDNAGALQKENSCGTSGTVVCWTPRASHVVATRRAGWLLHPFPLKFAMNAALSFSFAFLCWKINKAQPIPCSLESSVIAACSRGTEKHQVLGMSA